MRLKRVVIENFRSIKYCSIDFHEITAVVGENNSGKTAILRALNSFFNYEFEENDFRNGVHRYAPRTITKITIVLSDIPAKEPYQDKTDASGDLHIKFTYNYSKSSSGRRLYFEKNGSINQIDVSFLNSLKNDIDYVYIPINRSSKNLQWNNNSIFSRLIKKYLEERTRNRDRLSKSVRNAGNKMLVTALNQLAKELSALNLYSDIGQYDISFNEPVDYTVFLERLGLKIIGDDNRNSFPVSEYGSGVKSLTVIALHRMYAQLNNASIILGIEEPETNLHPQAQRMLIESLQKSRQSCETQAIFATHSTVIIDALDHMDIVLVRKVNDTHRGFHSETTQLSKSFWDDYDISELKHYNFFRYRNSDFFFSRFVILTESITDAQVVEYMLRQTCPKQLFYVSIVNLNGVENIRYPFFLLKSLNIPFVCVVDKDFFTTYKNGKLKDSRDPETLMPQYSGEISHNKVIDYIFDDEQKKSNLKHYLNTSYSQFFDYVKNYGLLSMRYCLEMDMIDIDMIREAYYNHYKLIGDKRIRQSLLLDRKEAIKDPTVLLPIFENIQPKDYPISFKKIRRELTKRVLEI